MLRCLRIPLLATLLAAAIFAAAPAFAAPATWDSVDVTLHSEQSGGVMLISGDLPESTALPAQAELSVPAGSKIQWIGEILGGETSADPALTYTKTTSGDADVYRFTLTKARTAQIEIPIAEALVTDGANSTANLVWTTAQALPQVRMSVRMPAGARIVEPTPGAETRPGPAGFAFYTKTEENVKAGQKLGLKVTYAAPAPLPAATAAATSVSASPATSAVPVVIALVLAGIGVALVISVRRKLAAKARRSAASSSGAASAKSSKRSGAARSTGAGVEQATSGMSGSAKRGAVTALLVGGLVMAAVIVGTQSLKPRAVGDSISKTFSQGAPCATATVTLAVPAGTDPTTVANKLFDALAPIDGMNTATFNAKTSSLDVGWCESKSNEVAVRQALAPTGLLATQ